MNVHHHYRKVSDVNNFHGAMDNCITFVDGDASYHRAACVDDLLESYTEWGSHKIMHIYVYHIQWKTEFSMFLYHFSKSSV